jgi:hypothetical protein
MKLCGGGLALGEVLLLHGTKLAERKDRRTDWLMLGDLMEWIDRDRGDAGARLK